MSLKTIANTAATYQEPVRPVQTANVKPTAIQDSGSNFATYFGSVGAPAAISEQQLGKNDNSQQRQGGNASSDQIKNAITQVNNKMKQVRTRCEFTYHEEANRVSIKVIDKETQETIREIPPEETIKMVEKIWELAGLLIDEKR